MAEYEVHVSRIYRLGETTSLSIECDTPEQALAAARKQDDEGELDDWEEDENSTEGGDVDSYEWTIKLDGKTLLTGRGQG
jgi:hypothetical protein